VGSFFINMINTDNITINTHSSIRIEGSKVIYFDPFEISEKSGDADIIFVTHDHYDHFDPESIACIANENTVLVAPESMSKQVYAKSGIAEEKCVFMKPHTAHEGLGVAVEAVPAYNKRKPFHTKGKDFLGYVVTMDETRYYVAGDTDMNEDIVGVKCDVALLPIGGTYTMDKKQALELVGKINPQVVIPTHYGSVIGKVEDGDKFAAMVVELDGEVRADIKIK